MSDYIPEHGNSGDACIALATRDRLEWFRDRHPGAIFLRGGGLSWYPNLHDAIRNAPGSLVILPSSIDDHVAKILAERKDVFLYCRGKRSLAIAKKHGIECALQPDLAFNLDLQSKGKGSETLWCFRGDIESATNFRTADNWDVSLLRHAVWTLENCEPSAREFIDAIDAFAEVETDRLHVAIIAALLGKVVTLYGTADHKVQEVYEFSLAKFPNVTFRRASDSWRGVAPRAIVIHQSSRLDRKPSVQELFRHVGNLRVLEAVAPTWDADRNNVAVRGCSLSHLRAIRLLSNDYLQPVLVLEDDAEVIPEAYEEWLNIPKLPDDCGAVLLGGDVEVFQDRGNGWFEITGQYWGTQAVAYNVNALACTQFLLTAYEILASNQIGPGGKGMGLCYESVLLTALQSVGLKLYCRRNHAFTTLADQSGRTGEIEPSRQTSLPIA